MTQTARLILKDAKVAIDRYSEDLQDVDFRISWIAIVTLLDSVNEGLFHVDRQISAAMKSAIEKKRRETVNQKSEMFEFINKGRNNFVHQYKHGVKKSTYSEHTIKRPDGSEAKFKMELSNAVGLRLDISNGRYKSAIAEGPFTGISEKVVALKAYDWWCKYLDEVDYLANEIASTPSA